MAVAAWAYEVHDDPVMLDSDFDELARQIDTSKSTGRAELDQWFRENFEPSTGMWVHKHPGTVGLEQHYRMLRQAVTREMTATDTLWLLAA